MTSEEGEDGVPLQSLEAPKTSEEQSQLIKGEENQDIQEAEPPIRTEVNLQNLPKVIIVIINM